MERIMSPEVDMYYVQPYEKKWLTVIDLYEDHSACDLTIRDYQDNSLIWHGEFEDMPIKYACRGFKKATVNAYSAEIEVII